MKEIENVYTWLDLVRKRPKMYVRSLHDLENQLYGYYSALSNHHIIESVPQMNHHFLIWVHYRTEWSASRGWPNAIESRVAGLDEQVAKFFELVDEYRQLRPTVLSRAHLTEKHKLTGKRVVIGNDGKMEKPNRVDIVQYSPEPLHFLRFHYLNKTIDDWLLMKPDGTYDTTLFDAKSWVENELLVKSDQWIKIT